MCNEGFTLQDTFENLVAEVQLRKHLAPSQCLITQITHERWQELAMVVGILFCAR